MISAKSFLTFSHNFAGAMSITSQEISTDDELDILEDIESQSIQERTAKMDPETRAIRILRGLIFVLLVLPGACFAYGFHRFIKNSQHESFSKAFEESAEHVVSSIQRKLSDQLVALDILASNTKEYVALSGSWPNVTYPSFSQEVEQINRFVSSKAMVLMPVIPENETLAWQEYASLSLGTSRDDPILQISIYPFEESDEYQSKDIALPIWQISPRNLNPSYYNLDMLSWDVIAKTFDKLDTFNAGLSEMVDMTERSKSQTLLRAITQDSESLEPHSVLVFSIEDSTSLHAIITSIFEWSTLLSDVDRNVICVFENECGQVYTYEVKEQHVSFLGMGDLHSTSFNDMAYSIELQADGDLTLSQACLHRVHVYPTDVMESSNASEVSKYAILLLVCFFAFFGIVVFAYDCLLQRRHREIKRKANRSTAIVSSLFPGQVRDRLLEDQSDKRLGVGSTYARSEISDSSSYRTSSVIQSPKRRLRNFLGSQGADDSDSFSNEDSTKPIADLFPHCTVFFGDIVGFTAWSSQRDPAQVFELLQSIYQGFDTIAKKLSVFKVETIGDSYLAVTGLPNPQENHAALMAMFAAKCRLKMHEVTRRLERSLGPDTSDLDMRIGLHSGPVTAGVLRGERSRFQLFGDTVNTAARMESTSLPGRIQISETTAELLRESGKGHWIRQRDDLVEAKGKGKLRTFWLDPSSPQSMISVDTERLVNLKSTWTILEDQSTGGETLTTFEQSTISGASKAPQRGMPKSRQMSMIWGASQEVFDMEPPSLKRNRSTTGRLVDWNVDLMKSLLRKIAVHRQAQTYSSYSSFRDISVGPLQVREFSERIVLDEVKEIIELPTLDQPCLLLSNSDDYDIDDVAEEQLRQYVAMIASMYRDNPFHNYEHACHVQMSMMKLLQRVVEPEDIDYEGSDSEIASQVHHFTHGITSDPLTQFAVLFSALIHDVDHTGVTNGQLIKEQAHIAVAYKNKSVAEQNSIDLAWELLMSSEFKELRNAIYANESERQRFRQIIVNVVLATDIFDKDLSAFRKDRWNKAFSREFLEPEKDAANRKATIVLEHMIQASDVSHTMQHFDVYRKWNEKLFFEMQMAFKSGRMESDPAPGWYKGEIWFFDNYVIPLAKKLKECGVFGVASDECLEYAVENRRLWELHGEELVKEMEKRDYLADQKKQSRRGRGALLGSIEYSTG